MIVAACLIGMGVWIGRGPALRGSGGETAGEYAARIASRDNLARFGFVRAELAREAGDQRAAAALEKLANEHDSTGILEWLRSVAASEPQNIEVRREILLLGGLLDQWAEAKTALSEAYELESNDIPMREFAANICYDDGWAYEAFIVRGNLLEKVNADAGPTERAWHQFHLGCEQEWASDFEPAKESFRRALDSFSAAGQAQGIAAAQFKLGWLALNEERRKEADHLLTSSLAQFESLGHPLYVADVNRFLGYLFRTNREFERGLMHYERTLQIEQRMGIPPRIKRAEKEWRETVTARNWIAKPPVFSLGWIRDLHQ